MSVTSFLFSFLSVVGPMSMALLHGSNSWIYHGSLPQLFESRTQIVCKIFQTKLMKWLVSRAFCCIINHWKQYVFCIEWRTAAAATATVFRGSARSVSSYCEKADCKNSTSRGWLYGTLAFPAAGQLLNMHRFRLSWTFQVSSVFYIIHNVSDSI